ncbi:4-(cytidine 5'-diphospho)-2-C-methyl-D-erythritol kinase [Fundidesulfovibrio butyratiphilus]
MTQAPAPPVILRTRCKINLFLKIVGVRPDGYHELVTLFHPVSEPHDILKVRPEQSGRGLVLTCSEPDLAGPDNLVAKAYRAFAARTGSAPDLGIELIKGAPSGAGLGGGSADAAAVLRYLNDTAEDFALSEPELRALAARLGADVPFFLGEGPAWATGVGERLRPVDNMLRGFFVVIAKGDEGVSTAWAYREWDTLAESRTGRNPLLTTPPGPSTEPFCVSGMRVANSFEAVIFPARPKVRTLKERLLALGASAAAMSGSGAAVFGLFRSRDRAEQAAQALEAQSFDVWTSAL